MFLYPCSIRKNKEEQYMKTTAIVKYGNYIPYPGAASRREQMHNLLDKCLLAASAIGIVAALMFLVVLV